MATSISLCMIIPALQAWARVAAAKKEALIKSTIERMMRLSVSKTIRYCWSQWCRYMRRTLAETVRRLHAERLDAERRFQELESKYQAQHGHDAANLQHEISAMLALHEHTCKARIDARQMSGCSGSSSGVRPCSCASAIRDGPCRAITHKQAVAHGSPQLTG